MSAWIPEDQKKNGDLLVPKAGAIGGVLEDANCDCNPNRANSDLAKCSWAKSSKSDCDLMDQQFCCDGTFDNKENKCKGVIKPGCGTCVKVQVPPQGSFKAQFYIQSGKPEGFVDPSWVGKSDEYRIRLDGFMTQILQTLGKKTLQVQENKDWKESGLRTFIVVRATAGMRKAVPTMQFSSINTWINFETRIKSTKCDDS